MDEISLLNLPIDELEKDHLRLIKEANLITVSAKKLLEQINLEYQTKAILINNAVSEEFIINLKNAKINKEINKSKNEGKKVIGYYGAIAEWLDFDLVNYLAENCKECDFIFIGPVFNTENEIKKLQENSPNIKFIKQIPHEKLLSYLKGFDICIIPFIKNELTDSVSPVKLFEYMANNKPIICTDLAECRNYKSVNIAENKDEFLEKIKENLIEGSNKKINKIEAKELDENTWESRVKTIVKHIK